MASIVVAGGDWDLQPEIRTALEFDGHSVTEAISAGQSIHLASAEDHDLLIANWIVDGIPAHGLCRTIRPRSKIGIVVAGPSSGAIDSLNAGADEYVATPFIMGEFTARVRAILRRVARPGSRQIVLADRTIDLDAHKVKGPDGRVSHLTPKESLVLECLASQPNKLRTHQSLTQTVWQRDADSEVEYLRVVVKQLRRKIEPDPDRPRYILTERAIGYRFQVPQTQTESVSVV
jgi:two-component system KDP operon response regulator KdpE